MNIKHIRKILVYFIILIFFSYFGLSSIFKVHPYHPSDLARAIYESLSDRYKVILKLTLNKPLTGLDVKKFSSHLDASKILSDQKDLNKLNNDYNVKFLPETQYLDLNFVKKKFDFLSHNEIKYLNQGFKVKSFFIDATINDIFFTSRNGEFFFSKINDLKENKLKITNIKSNIKTKKILDTLIHNNKIFVSYVVKSKDCSYKKISYAKINLTYLKFEKIFDSNECGKNIQGGRMQILNFNDKEGILFTTGDNKSDEPSMNPQISESIFGKLIFLDLDTKNYFIYSKGHRNPQGLIVLDNLILSTEHGPRGGDEINKIVFSKNYGWPISSYGQPYHAKDIKYEKNHYLNNFEEPLYSFVPSIGISEIIIIPNSFSPIWENNFLIASLNGKKLLRVLFDKNFKRVIYIEEIFIGERIRDLKYINKINSIIVSLESGEIGIISVQS